MAEDTNGAVVVVVRTKAHAHQSFIRQHIQALSKLCVRCVMFAHKIPAEETRKQIGLLNAWVGSQKIMGRNPRRFPWVSVERLFWGYFLSGRPKIRPNLARSRGPKGQKIVGNSWHFSRISLRPTRSASLETERSASCCVPWNLLTSMSHI